MKAPYAAALAFALLISACGAGSGAQPQRLTVFAAASLTESFGELAERFEADHAGVDVQLVFDGSSKLAQQLEEGAQADVFASADKKNMDKVTGLLRGEPAVFATNKLTIAVEPGNPEGITGLADLAREELTVVVCAPQVPCGAAAEKLAKLARVKVAADSEEPDVRSVLGKVRAGEADAALVYVTDVASADGAVDAVDVPEAGRAINDYPIAVLDDAQRADLARAFVELVRSSAGQRVLKEAGFGPP